MDRGPKAFFLANGNQLDRAHAPPFGVGVILVYPFENFLMEGTSAGCWADGVGELPGLLGQKHAFRFFFQRIAQRF